MIIPAGKFKAQCLKLMDTVNRTGEEVVITKRGRPVAKLVRAEKPKRPKSLLGYMAGTVKITGDIIAPIDEVWNAEK